MSARTFRIQRGTYKGKHIKVVYFTTRNHGVDIKIEHNLKATRGRMFRWVQTVYENGTVAKKCGRRRYVDGWAHRNQTTGKMTCNADDGMPFYYTKKELKTQKTFGRFYDDPAEPAPKTGRTWLRFTTSLVEVTGKNIVILVSIYWGFDRRAGGRIVPLNPRRAAQAEVKKQIQVLKSMHPKYGYSLAK